MACGGLSGCSFWQVMDAMCISRWKDEVRDGLGAVCICEMWNRLSVLLRKDAEGVEFCAEKCCLLLNACCRDCVDALSGVERRIERFSRHDQQAVRWCSWLSRSPHTRKVLSSSLSRISRFFFASLRHQCQTFHGMGTFGLFFLQRVAFFFRQVYEMRCLPAALLCRDDEGAVKDFSLGFQLNIQLRLPCFLSG